MIKLRENSLNHFPDITHVKIGRKQLNAMKIAALLTCFNRKNKTLACLKSLFSIVTDCHVYLVDDGSTDGTSEAIKQKYPQVHIIKGNGNLFWSRGMYTAWKEAIKGSYDFYLWLNDDVELYPFFLQELTECMTYGQNQCIVSGLIENFEKTKILYGGSDKNKKLIQPNKTPQEITFMNGNVVLIPAYVVDKIGIIDPKFHHDLGDVDYGLTAIKNNIKVYSTRTPIAAGYSNNFCRIRKWNTTLKNRFKKLYSPLGSPPSINFYFRKKHYGIINAIEFITFIYILNILPDSLITKIWGDTYKDK